MEEGVKIYDCPVFPCLETFTSIVELRNHLINVHRRSVRKHGLNELLEYAKHGKSWYVDCWREIYLRSSDSNKGVNVEEDRYSCERVE